MKQEITIIGAGVSGLTAALHLEALGYQVSIYEASKSAGGRVKSEVFEDYILDVGFQVLLSAYPMAQKYLDYSTLNLKEFDPGAYVFKNAEQFCVGDPLRNFSYLIPTLLAKIGSLGDKLKIYKLTNKLKTTSIDTIFASAEITTLQYLKDFGFSNQIIEDFFIPFFGGIFLENELSTSSRKFEFIFKMFSEGKAVIPSKGIQAIPDQLASKLKATKIHFLQKVEKILGNNITFEDGKTISADFIILATDTANLIPNLPESDIKWKSTQTLYFEVEKDLFPKPLIGLLSSKEGALINSISFPKTKIKETRNQLLSVSIVKEHSLTEYELIQKVKEELKTHFSIDTLRFLKTYDIPKALPKLSNIQYTLSPSELQLTQRVFLAGDTMLNGSLNAAMLSGELAAGAVHEKVTGTVLG